MESIIFVIGGICVFSVGCLLCMECCTDGESIESANIIETVQTLHTTQTPLPNASSQPKQINLTLINPDNLNP